MKNGNHASLQEKLIRSIRGYVGYQTTKDRQRTDKRLRDYIVDELKQIEKSFVKILNRMTQQGHTQISEIINKLIHLLSNLLESLNKPSYYNSSFFNQTTLNENILNQIYQYESQLKYHLMILKDEVADLEKIERPADTIELLNHLFDVIDNLNHTIIEREFLLTNNAGSTL